MDEYLGYIANAALRAGKKAWSVLGLGSALCFLLFELLLWGTSEMNIVVQIIAALLFVFLVAFVWELQAVFAEVVTKKRNTMYGAELVVTNNEVVDLTNLEVEFVKRTWVSRSAGRIRMPIDPNNRFLDVGDDPRVSYGGGSKTILLASGESKTATFHAKVHDHEIGFEHYDNADRAAFEIVVRVKGKISGRPIYPRRVQGTLSYIRAEQKFEIPSLGTPPRTVENVLSKMEWKDPDYSTENQKL